MNYRIILIFVLVLILVNTVKADCYSINQISSAYGFPNLFSKGIDGSNISVAIVDAYGAPNLLSDVNTFFSNNQIPILTSSNFHIFYPFGNSNSFNSNWSTEVESDVEILHSLAPGANISLVIAPNASYLFQTLNWTINNLNIKVISISWGTVSNNYISPLNTILANAYNKGITVFAGTGDEGAYNGGSSLSVNFPASSQYVVAVGGTYLQIEGNQYVSETGWSGSGGGISNFPALSFEKSSNGYRELPDVSFNAGYPYCLYINNTNEEIYGTSLAAPAWAAIGAEIYQINPSLGNILPSLYRVYAVYGYKAFHQINSGCNGYYCANGSYNLVTGIGSPILPNLVYYIDNYTYNLTSVSKIPFVININGENFTSPFSVRFPFNTRLSIKVYPVLFNSDLYIPLTRNLTLTLNSSIVLNVSYNVEYPVNIINYRPSVNLTLFLNHSEEITFPSLVSITNGHFINLSAFYGNSSVAFYNNVSKLQVVPSNSYRINWIKLRSSLINSNYNCINIFNGITNFKVNSGVYVYFLNQLDLYPCTLEINSSALYTFPSFSSRADVINVNYTLVKFLKSEVYTLNNFLVSNYSEVYFYFGNQILSDKELLEGGKPIYVTVNGFNFSVANYTITNNSVKINLLANYLLVQAQPAFLPIPVKVLLLNNPSYYVKGINSVSLLIPPNSTVRVQSPILNSTYITSGGKINIVLLSSLTIVEGIIIISVVIVFIIAMLLRRHKKF